MHLSGVSTRQFDRCSNDVCRRNAAVANHAVSADGKYTEPCHDVIYPSDVSDDVVRGVEMSRFA